MTRSTTKKKLDVDDVRSIALTFNDTIEATSYGTTAWFVEDGAKKHLFARMLPEKDGGDVVVAMDLGVRDAIVAERPDQVRLTEHYRAYPWVIVKLDGGATFAQLKRYVKDAHDYAASLAATKKSARRRRA